ncbi:MAG: peptide ABC transporter substrate-binding protein [Deltaproteobacteria bacterium]|nr:peptide ABC transporter substrate-binding protein [Deltaproteobacteria bacterium]
MVIFILLQGCFKQGSDYDKNSEIKGCTCDENEFNNLNTEEDNLTPYTSGILTMQINSEPGIMLSMFSGDNLIKQIIDHSVLQSLISIEPDTLQFKPELATGWELSENKKSYTFYLDNNAKWHDGVKFTANDVRYTFETMLDTGSGAVISRLYEDVADVEVVDDYTVVITLDKPGDLFLLNLTQLMILPEHIFKNTTVISHEQAYAPIGTGPFIFDTWKRGQYIKIIRNRSYHNPKPQIKGVEFKIISENRIALNMFKKGGVDIISPVTDNGTLKNKNRFVFADNKITALLFNHKKPLFKSVSIRRAIAHLIDKNAIRCSLLNCLAKSINSPWHDIHPDHPFFYSPLKARQILDESGWKDLDGDTIREKNGQKLEFQLILADDNINDRRMMTVIQHDLATAGIEMKIVIVSRSVYIERLQNHQFDLSIITIPTRPPYNAGSYFSSINSGSDYNYGQFKDNETDDLFTQFNSMDIDNDKTKNKIANRLQETVPAIFLFDSFKKYFVSSRVHGLKLSFDGFKIDSFWLSKNKDFN